MYLCCLHLPLPDAMTARHLPLTRWQQRTTCVCGWSIATSKPNVCSNTFSLNTRSCACSRYFCMTIYIISVTGSETFYEFLDCNEYTSVTVREKESSGKLLHFLHFLLAKSNISIMIDSLHQNLHDST